MEEYVINLIADFGYLGMFLGMILEAVIIIIPSEAILATGGILSSRGVFSFWPTFIVGMLGSVFCAIILYAIGYYGGEVFVQKYGKYFFIKKEDLDKSSSWFSKYGLFAACIGRNFPIIRTLVSLPIGIMRLDFFKFTLYTTLGSIPWTFAFIYMGYALGNNWIILKEYTSRLKVPIRILIIILIITFIYSKIKKTKKKSLCYTN